MRISMTRNGATKTKNTMGDMPLTYDTTQFGYSSLEYDEVDEKSIPSNEGLTNHYSLYHLDEPLKKFLDERNQYAQVEGVLLDHFPFEKLQEAVTYFYHKYILPFDKKGQDTNHYGILYDVDVDGLFSGFLIENMLTRLGKSTVNYINPNKKHGLTEEGVKWAIDNQLTCLFIVDGGSGDSETINQLNSKGIEVFVLDHHPYEKWETSELAHIINVTEGKEEGTPQLSGCGVVYRFIEKLGQLTDTDTEKYLRYVGLTVISDMCSIVDKENKFYVEYLYKYYEMNGKNDWFYQQFRFYGSKKSLFGWSIAPYLNGLIRIGLEKKAVEMVTGIENINTMNRIPTMIKSIREIQNGHLTTLMASGKIVETSHTVIHLRKNNEIIKHNDSGDHTYQSTLNGLLANKIGDKYRKNALVLCLVDGEWKGSFRGKTYTKHTLEKYGLNTGGHDYACGVWGKPEDLLHFLKTYVPNTANEPTEDDEEYIYFTIESPFAKNLYDQKLIEIAMYNEFAFTGSGVKPIRVRIKNIHKENKTVLLNYPSRQEYRVGNYNFIQFNSDEAVYTDSDVFDVTVTTKRPYYELVRVKA